MDNPYVNLSLRIPEHDWEGVRRYTGTFRDDQGKSRDIDSAPFDRYVDLWWAALCLGVSMDRRQTVERWHDFVTGVVLNSEPWRIRQLELVALSQAEDASVLERHGEVINIANEFAAAGIVALLDGMAGSTQPIWSVSELYRSRLSDSLDADAVVNVWHR